MRLVTTAAEHAGGWEVEAAELGISGCGSTREEAERDLTDMIALTWAEYSRTPREQMTADAIVLLERMRRAGVGG